MRQLRRWLTYWAADWRCFTHAFGDVDAYVVVDVPDSVTATAMALAVNQTGAVTVKTVVLITPEGIDNAGKKVVGYRAPGR